MTPLGQFRPNGVILFIDTLPISLFNVFYPFSLFSKTKFLLIKTNILSFSISFEAKTL